MRLKSLILSFLLSWLWLTSLCFASLNLSVNPVDGSNSLRFDKITAAVNKNVEVHIRISSTDGKQYQVFQRILEPMINEKGESLNLQAMKTQTLSNSNSSGTLYLQNADHLTMSDQLIYSSAQGGVDDSFIVGYSLDQNLISAAGNFRGRIVYEVRGASSEQVTLDVLLEASSNLKITVKGAHSPLRVHIQGSDTSERTADFVNISFTGNPSQQVRIYQEIESMPQNEAQVDLGPDVLQLDAQGDTEGLRAPGATSVKIGRTLIYSSNKESDNFLIYYLVNANQDKVQDAGAYRGKIKYLVETSQGTQEFPIDIQYDIPPVFTLNVTTPAGGVNFTHVLASSPPQEEEVLVTVLSNLHKPYQVLQNLQSSMTNNQGKEFNNKYFDFQVELPSGQKGQSDFTEFSPVQTGEYPVFSSDAQGHGATFKVVYRLQGYAQMSPGNFLAPIRFSLDQK